MNVPYLKNIIDTKKEEIAIITTTANMKIYTSRVDLSTLVVDEVHEVLTFVDSASGCTHIVSIDDINQVVLNNSDKSFDDILSPR